MDIKKIYTIYETIVNKTESEPESLFAWFSTELKNFEYQEREVLYPFVKRYHARLINENFEPAINIMYLTEILHELDGEHVGNEGLFQELNLKGVTDIEIAKLFYELKVRGYIINTLPEISIAVSMLFGLKNTTILSYLSNPKERFPSVRLLLENKA
jgi:hypothetical protein